MLEILVSDDCLFLAFDGLEFSAHECIGTVSSKVALTRALTP